MTTKEIPVLLLTGYLGSGKTTLVNHILANKQGIRFAVIVNDIGEVNIDADLIQKGGIVGKKDESLVALQNGCICCTLKTDLIEQIGEIMRMERFDYIVIEASGICEPEPIAQTICSIPRLGGMYTQYGICRLDCITTVVDALRLQDEFACGNDLTRKGIDEEDIENLSVYLHFEPLKRFFGNRSSFSARMEAQSRYLSCCGGSIPAWVCCSTVHPCFSRRSTASSL